MMQFIHILWLLASLSQAQVPIPFTQPPQLRAVLSNLSLTPPRPPGPPQLEERFPFVRVLDFTRWAACGGRLDCQARAEWAIPLKPARAVEAFEHTLSYQWNLFDARTYWHAQARVTPQMELCARGVTDPLLGIPWGQPSRFLDGQAFCLGADRLAPVAFEAYGCDQDPPYYLDRAAIEQRIAQAYGPILAEFTYPQMWEPVLEHLIDQLPLSLVWSRVLPSHGHWSEPLEGNAVLLWVYDSSGPSHLATLREKASQLGTLGRAYYAYGPQEKGGSLARQAQTALLPPAQRQALWQEIYRLEGLKYRLAETRRGIFDQPLQWSLPRQALPTEPHPATTLEEYEYLGYATAFWLMPQRTSERTPRGGGRVVYPYLYCWKEVVQCDGAGPCSPQRQAYPLPPEYFAVPAYRQLNRWNTAFFAVAAGFQLKDGRRQPQPLLTPERENLSGQPRSVAAWLATLDWPQAGWWLQRLQSRLEQLRRSAAY